MKAYGVFSGGGVKGIALAGALAASTDAGIEFQGFGGTSAGALVATLAAAGFTGSEIKSLMADRPMESFLDDEGERVRAIQATAGDWSNSFKRRGRVPKVKSVKAVRQLWPQIRSVIADQGLYRHDLLGGFLVDTLTARFPGWSENGTLSDLSDLGAAPLKIVASDIASQRAVVYSNNDDEGPSVVEAVSASTCYPLLFQPLRSSTRVLLDGGLASNLPAFLYVDEFQETRHPTFAFDLRPVSYDDSEDALGFGKSLVGTALEASDHLLREGSRGVYHIPVSIPAAISTFSFDLKRGDVDVLFNSGYASVSEYLNSLDQLQWEREAGGDLKRRLQTVYGDPKLFQPILKAVADFIEEQWRCENVRCSIMVPTGRGTRMVAYDFNMDSDPDADLELAENGGCTGLAYTTGEPAVADLTPDNIDYSSWNMTQGQQAKVLPTQLAMVAMPIRASSNDRKRTPVIATLGVDASTPLPQTGWVYGKGESVIDAQFVGFLRAWVNVISKVMN